MGVVTAIHDRSDGGLITTVAEMCLAANCGAELVLENLDSE
jgi:phosphoribosylformylglycinamidine synthase